MGTEKEAPQMERDEALKYVDMHAMSDFVSDLGDTTPTQTVYTALLFALREPERARRLMAPIERQLADIRMDGDADPTAQANKSIDEFLTHWTGMEAEPFETARQTKNQYEQHIPALREARQKLAALREAIEKGEFKLPTDEVIPLGAGSKGLVN